MSDKKKTYKVKDKNIVKLNNYYNKRTKENGKRNILHNLVWGCIKDITND